MPLNCNRLISISGDVAYEITNKHTSNSGRIWITHTNSSPNKFIGFLTTGQDYDTNGIYHIAAFYANNKYNYTDSFHPRLKSLGIVSTTTASGYVTTDISIASKVVVAALDKGSNNSYIVIPFVANKMYWYFSVLRNSNVQFVANTQMDILYYYYDL